MFSKHSISVKNHPYLRIFWGAQMSACIFMIFNFTRNYQFSTRFELDGQIIETVQEAKLLGTIVNSDLKWDENTNFIVR